MAHFKVCYPAIFHPEEVGYTVVVPDMEQINCGCTTCGDTFEEACEMAFSAIGLCLEEIVEQGGALPIPTRPEIMEYEKGDFIVPIIYDSVKYLKSNKDKAVKKTLTIPEWLNDLAIKEKINFSQVLQMALKQHLNIE